MGVYVWRIERGTGCQISKAWRMCCSPRRMENLGWNVPQVLMDLWLSDRMALLEVHNTCHKYCQLSLFLQRS